VTLALPATVAASALPGYLGRERRREMGVTGPDRARTVVGFAGVALRVEKSRMSWSFGGADSVAVKAFKSAASADSATRAGFCHVKP